MTEPNYHKNDIYHMNNDLGSLPIGLTKNESLNLRAMMNKPRPGIPEDEFDGFFQLFLDQLRETQ